MNRSSCEEYTNQFSSIWKIGNALELTFLPDLTSLLSFST